MSRMKVAGIISAPILIVLFCVFVYIPNQKLPKKVDNIYVINLEKSKKRLETFDIKMKKASLEYKIFKGVYGVDLKIKDSYGNIINARDLASKKTSLRLGETYKIMCPNLTITYKYDETDMLMQPGTMGCYCSHLELMHHIAKNHEKMSIIFEDDANIPQDLKEKIDDILNTPVPKWNMIYLGLMHGEPSLARKMKSFRKILFNNKISKLTSGMMGLQGYIVNEKGINEMLKRLTKTNKQIDYQIYDYVKKDKIKILFANDFNINQNVGLADSEIGRVNDNQKIR
jgi:glycosyl transferase family 25